MLDLECAAKVKVVIYRLVLPSLCTQTRALVQIFVISQQVSAIKISGKLNFLGLCFLARSHCIIELVKFTILITTRWFLENVLICLSPSKCGKLVFLDNRNFLSRSLFCRQRSDEVCIRVNDRERLPFLESLVLQEMCELGAFYTNGFCYRRRLFMWCGRLLFLLGLCALVCE